jgi:hypothetical protein
MAAACCNKLVAALGEDPLRAFRRIRAFRSSKAASCWEFKLHVSEDRGLGAGAPAPSSPRLAVRLLIFILLGLDLDSLFRWNYYALTLLRESSRVFGCLSIFVRDQTKEKSIGRGNSSTDVTWSTKPTKEWAGNQEAIQIGSARRAHHRPMTDYY